MYNRRNFGVMPRVFGGLIEDVLANGWNHAQEEAVVASVPVNIKETDTSYELHLAAPGLKKEDFKISIDRNLLTVSFEQKTEQKTEQKEQAPAEGKWIRSEFRVRSFKRTFTLNDKVDVARIGAKYADGILEVALPKKETTEPATMEISVN